MKFTVLDKEKYQVFASKHPLASFHQTCYWGELKEKTNWTPYYVGLLDSNDEIQAAALLLAKDTPIKKRMFYSPRGLLVDYHNQKILEKFTKGLKKFVKKEKGFFLKIDPYLDYKERDIDGNIIPNGFNNEDAYKNLVNLGYKHLGFNIYQDTLQPRWIFTTTTKNRSLESIMKEMDPKTRQVLNRNERLGMTVREIKEDELDKFKKVMEHTSSRREFLDRSYSYYQNMLDILGKGNMIKVMLAELDTKKIIENLNSEIASEVKAKEERLKKKEQGLKMNEAKFNQKQLSSEATINRLQKKVAEMNDLAKKHGDIIVLGGILFLIWGNEVLSLVGGSYSEFMEYNSAYTIHFAGLKYAVENNYDRYNFYGITGDFKETNPLYGLYLFKRGFSGQVEELLGEFDLVINKPSYLIYKLAFHCYHKLKQLNTKFQKKL